ncbi:MAG: DUF1194 domain-containing protein [Alphaproteobacteria bacterium]|nr:DUF1194 domain-containing protein [Alphaproteobacteria bacterium]
MWRKSLVALLCGIAAWSAIAGPARAQPVDLLLILAVDASGSVDNDEWALQMKGYEDAWRDPEVHRAIATAGRHRALAVTFVQWSGYGHQLQTIGWTRVASAQDANAFADMIAGTGRQIWGGGTSLSGIIDYAVPLFESSPFQGERKVLDISGDGANRNSRPADQARDEAVAKNVTINGLPILGSEAGLDRWYQANVVGGPGGFMVVAESFQSFGRAIRNKLIREIAALE